MKRIEDLGPNECRWPVQSRGGDHLFCAAITDGHMWCTAHRSVGVTMTNDELDRFQRKQRRKRKRS